MRRCGLGILKGGRQEDSQESTDRGDRLVPRKRGVMSEEFKVELAKDLGFYDTVQREGWGGIRTRDAGNMVRRAIEIAEQALRERHDTDL